MNASSQSSWIIRAGLVGIGTLLLGLSLGAQPTKTPSADEIKALQKKYQMEREGIVKAGIAQRFLPAIMDKADELAKKSETSLGAGRLGQAAEAIRQARWQLPYQPVGVPDNVSRIIGNLRLRHMGGINAVAFSPDGLKVATASTDTTVKIWDLGNGHEILTYTGHQAKIVGLAWTPDGKFIVSAGNEKNIKVWNAETGKDEKTIPATGEFVSSLVLSKDGKHVFTGQLNVPGNPPNGLFVHEVKTGKLVREVRDFTNRIDAIALNTEGTILAAGDGNGNTRLFQYPSFVDNVNQPAYWAQQDFAGATYFLTFSPDDKTLVRCSPHLIQLFNTPLPGAPFQVAEPRKKIETRGQRCAVFSHDGKTLFTGDFKGNINLWDPDSGDKTGEYKNAHSLPVNSLAFNRAGNQLASSAGDFTIRLWDFNVSVQSRDYEGHELPVWTAAFSPDGSKLISSSADKTVRVWSRDTGDVLFNLKDHTAPVTVALFSPDGKLIASAGGDKLVRIFDATNGKQLRTGEGHTGTITFLDFSQDSKKIVSCGVDRKIKIWDADKGTEIKSIDDNPSIASSVAFSPNGKQIAVGNIDQSIRLYDADTGKLQSSWAAHGTAVNGVSYSPNGQMLASCGADMTVAVWPLATPGQNSIRMSGHTGPVSTAVFRMDNVHLVSCGADQMVKLWKIEGNAAKDVQTFRGHKDWVTSAAFSKDGFHVVSSSVDRRLKIWEITSREMPILAEHTNAVQAVAVSPDGETIATGSEDRTIKLWNRKTGVEIATLTGNQTAVMALIFTPDGKRIISSSAGRNGIQNEPPPEIRFWEISPPREIARTPQQLNFFGPGRLRRYSPYIATDPLGKALFVWFPVKEASTNMIVDAFDMATGEPLLDQGGLPTFKETTTNGNRKVNCLAFCANGKLAANGAENGSVRLWEMQTDKEPKGAKIAPGGDWMLFDKVGVADLAITPDASTLVAGSDKGEIKIAKIQGREVLKTIQAHKTGVGAVIMSPDGKRFATIGTDNVVKAWSIDGTELRSFDMGRHHGLFVINFAFSPDGKQLVTANANTTVYVLDLP